MHARTHVHLGALKKALTNDKRMSTTRKRAIFQLKESQCQACDLAKKSKKHTKQSLREVDWWTKDISGPYPRSRSGNSWMFMNVAPDTWGELEFGKNKSDDFIKTKENKTLWETS